MEYEKVDKKKAKILFLFSLVTLGFIIFIGTLFYWTQIDRRLPSLQTSESTTALRGDIVSADGFTVSTSQKLYKVMVDTRNIDIGKRELFVNLYSLYSGDDPKQVLKRLQSNKGNVILSYKIDAKRAEYLQELSRKLYKQGVFSTYEDPKTGLAFLRGMSIVESGEDRIYPNSDALTPVVGYVKKIEQNKITKVAGVKGIERYYEDRLHPIQDALVIGPKDVGHTVILNRDSEAKKRIDGYSIKLSISMKLQKIIERLLDEKRAELDAKEIIVGVMKSDTGEMLALATSSRYDPDNILRSDYGSLNATALEHIYEPGSVMKSITFALLLKGDKVNPYDLVRTYGGKYKLGNRVIRDTHDFEWLSAEDVIVHSSNVGIVQLAQKLDPVEFYQGLKDFGFTEKSGLDLPYENVGSIPPLQKFTSETYKATVGYGYGMEANFMQILKAYNVFNNKGRMVTPYIGVYFQTSDGKRYDVSKPPERQVLPISIAKRMKHILVKTVQKGTATRAQTEGLEIGGKTGTAHIAVNGKYENIYNSSFVGFANDKNNHFTIGVLVREPKKRYYYFASLSAVPVFKAVVDQMVEEQYLNPSFLEE